MTASRKPIENDPFKAALRFHVEEAIASGARVAVLIWEGDKGIEVATVPQAKAVARRGRLRRAAQSRRAILRNPP